jgi:hypothetical protein
MPPGAPLCVFRSVSLLTAAVTFDPRYQVGKARIGSCSTSWGGASILADHSARRGTIAVIVAGSSGPMGETMAVPAVRNLQPRDHASPSTPCLCLGRVTAFDRFDYATRLEKASVKCEQSTSRALAQEPTGDGHVHVHT